MTQEQAIISGRKRWPTSQAILRSGLCKYCKEVFFTFAAPNPKYGFGQFCSRSCNNKNHVLPGRTILPDGYAMVRCVSHPRVKDMVRRGGRIWEHILVMEAHIGRHLVKGETVHHKNGIRSDNRIDNLELWASPQPSGQRVMDLARYLVDNHLALIRALVETKDAVMKLRLESKMAKDEMGV